MAGTGRLVLGLIFIGAGVAVTFLLGVPTHLPTITIPGIPNGIPGLTP